MPFEVLASATAPPLEREILARLAAVQQEDPFRPVLIVAPTGRLLVRLRRLVMTEGKTRWGLHLLHHRLLARRIVESAGETPLRLLRSRQLRALLAELLLAGPPSGLARRVLGQAGSLASLHATLRDLREAGLKAATARAAAKEEAKEQREGSFAELLCLYASYTEALRRLADSGKGDAAALAEQAARSVHRSRLVAEAACLLHHGAYDLTGINRLLLEKIAKRIPVTLFVPGVAAGPAFEHARQTLRLWVGPEAFDAARHLPTDPASGGEERFVSRLTVLYDEKASAQPVEVGVVEAVSATGAEGELEAAARRILQLHSTGIPLEEMAIVARTLEPYAPFLEAVLGRDCGLPFTTSAKSPLRRDPAVRAFRDLLTALQADFPYRALIDFLCSAEARLEPLLPSGATARPDRWKHVARRCAVLHGQEGWLQDLPGWAAERSRLAEEGLAGVEEEGLTGIEEEGLAGLAEVGVAAEEGAGVEAKGEGSGTNWGRRRLAIARGELEDAQTLAAVVRSLAGDLERWRGCVTWADHASFLGDLAQERLRKPRAGGEAPRAALRALLAALEERGEIARAAGAPAGAVPAERAFRAVMEAIDGEMLPKGSAQGPGIAVLDMMQARGLSFRCVLWLGLNTVMLPRRPRADPFLADSARLEIRRLTGAPVLLKGDAIREERLLVALTLGSARERLILSWQRADERGRGMTPSIVLRELARALIGRAEMRAITGGEGGRIRLHIVPAHPALRAERESREGTGLVPFRDAAVALATLSEDPRETLRGLPGVAGRAEMPPEASIECALATGGFERGELAWDGTVGPVIPAPGPWSPKRLEMMGLCPLRYFFRYGLGIYEQERRGDRSLLDPSEIGSCVHRILQRFWPALLDGQGHPNVRRAAAGDLAELTASRISELFDEETALLAARVSRRYPALWQGVRSRWIEALVRGVYRDLRRLLEEQARIGAVEKTLSAEFASLNGGSFSLRGRLDRLDILPDGSLRVVDYKTAGSVNSVKKMIDLKEALRAERLQIPLYGELAARCGDLPGASGGEDLSAASGSQGPLPPRGRVIGQVLPIGPGFDADLLGRWDELVLEWPPADGSDSLAESFRHTLQVLVDMAERGSFPLNDDGPCRICEYAPACRKSHPPSVERVRSASSYRPYFLLKEKTKAKPFPPATGMGA